MSFVLSDGGYIQAYICSFNSPEICQSFGTFLIYNILNLNQIVRRGIIPWLKQLCYVCSNTILFASNQQWLLSYYCYYFYLNILIHYYVMTRYQVRSWWSFRTQLCLLSHQHIKLAFLCESGVGEQVHSSKEQAFSTSHDTPKCFPLAYFRLQRLDIKF